MLTAHKYPSLFVSKHAPDDVKHVILHHPVVIWQLQGFFCLFVFLTTNDVFGERKHNSSLSLFSVVIEYQFQGEREKKKHSSNTKTRFIKSLSCQW